MIVSHKMKTFRNFS